jgi:hypothetical protein
MGIQRAQCLQDNVKQAGLGGVKKMIEVTINVPSTMSAERLFPLQSHQPRRTISNCVVGAKIQTQKSSERVRFSRVKRTTPHRLLGTLVIVNHKASIQFQVCCVPHALGATAQLAYGGV